MAHKLTGKPLRIQRVDQLDHDVKGVLQAPRVPNGPWEILYRAGQEPFLEHIIAHEVGHVVRLFGVPPDGRLQPAITPETRRTVVQRLGPDLARLLAVGLPEDTLPLLFDTYLGGLGSQIASFPADLRIEAWIHRQYPGLRPVQERALVQEVARSFPLLRPEVMALTPPAVYVPTMAMNAAQACQVAELYHRPQLLEPFQVAGLVEIGQHLLEVVLDASDHGHRSDVAAVNQWARVLGLTGWFEWAPYAESR